VKKYEIIKQIVTTKIYDLVRETPLDRCGLLSAKLGNSIHLKREDQQPTFSFKVRGAYHKMTRMGAAKLEKGVIAASAGNHAQGVALAASRLGTSASIVMPKHTQRIKTSAVRKLGAKVILEGENFDEASGSAKRLAAETGMTFIHPFDDYDIICGQGTIAPEILRAHTRPIDAIYVAIGGGGLASGIAAYVKEMSPQTRVIGVEASDSASMSAAFAAGRPVRLPSVGIFADAVAVRKAGAKTYRMCRDLLDEIVVVENDEICAAIKEIYGETRMVVEPAGALGIAGIMRHAAGGMRDRDVVAISCGANMDFDRLRFVSERAELGESREILIAATIPERPGSFKRFSAKIGKHNITEFNYRISDDAIAHVFAGIEIERPDDKEQIIAGLEACGFRVADLTSNELAKLHVRHMVGGRAALAKDERIYRFAFPERPGALHNFLNKMSPSWNISMFHYRNHGADYGRVFVGFQVPEQDNAGFKSYLQDLGYSYVSEADNPAYDLFLSAPSDA